MLTTGSYPFAGLEPFLASVQIWIVMLHNISQERIAAAAEKESGSRWRGAYFMPAQADRMVLEFRRWLDKRGAGGPTPGDPGPFQDDRSALLDRYEQHTKHCPSCLKVRSLLAFDLVHSKVPVAIVTTRIYTDLS